jgi:Ca2+-binding EF-hand superfamily protein
MFYLDSNQDGFISTSEFEGLQQLTGGSIDENTLNWMFSMMDTDLDQKISWNEAFVFAQANDQNNGYRKTMSFYSKTDQVNAIF